MNYKLSAGFLTILVVTLSGSAQIGGYDFSANVRANYGPPLGRETFLVPVGEMVIDYAQSGHVCRIQLPPIGPDAQQPGVKGTKAVDDFLLTLVPESMRGRELGKRIMSTGAPSVSIVEYENVIIAESRQGNRRTGMTVTFKNNEECPKQTVQ